jgi:pimeloyl-ACP methyl ester carboxylesterase
VNHDRIVSSSWVRKATIGRFFTYAHPRITSNTVFGSDNIMPTSITAGFRAIAVDPRGLGHSSLPEEGYDTGRLEADLHGLMQPLGPARRIKCDKLDLMTSV